MGRFVRAEAGLGELKEVCGVVRQEWYPLFESHFLFGTVLDDFSRLFCEIGLDCDFRIGKDRYFRSGRIGGYRNGSLNAIQG